VSVLEDILEDLKKYKNGEKDVKFSEEYILVTEIEKEMIDKMYSTEGSYEVTTTKLVAVGYAKIYKYIEKLKLLEAKRMLVKVLADAKVPISFRELKVPFGKISSMNNVKVRLLVHRELSAIINNTAKSLCVAKTHFYRICLCLGLIEYGLLTGNYKAEIEEAISDFIQNVARFAGMVWSTLISAHEIYGDIMSNEVREEFNEFLIEEFPELAGSDEYCTLSARKVDKVLKAVTVDLAKDLGVSLSTYINRGLRYMAVININKKFVNLITEEIRGDR